MTPDPRYHLSPGRLELAQQMFAQAGQQLVPALMAEAAIRQAEDRGYVRGFVDGELATARRRATVAVRVRSAASTVAMAAAAGAPPKRPDQVPHQVRAYRQWRDGLTQEDIEDLLQLVHARGLAAAAAPPAEG